MLRSMKYMCVQRVCFTHLHKSLELVQFRPHLSLPQTATNRNEVALPRCQAAVQHQHLIQEKLQTAMTQCHFYKTFHKRLSGDVVSHGIFGSSHPMAAFGKKAQRIGMTTVCLQIKEALFPDRLRTTAARFPWHAREPSTKDKSIHIYQTHAIRYTQSQRQNSWHLLRKIAKCAT